MRIAVRELTDEVNEFEHGYDPDELDLGTKELKYNSVRVKVKVRIGRSKIFVKGEYNCKVEIECVRCLKMFEDVLQHNFNFEYDIPKQKEYIDITEDVRGEIILNYPKKPLCEENCRGLCPKCGKNLNISDCDCKRKGLDSFNPFSELANNFNN